MTPSCEGVFCDGFMGGMAVNQSNHEQHPQSTAVHRWTMGTSFVTEFGAVLEDIEVVYETHGSLDRTGANAILVCHALTGDTHAADGDGRPGWWGGLIGPGRVLDTDRYYIICVNVLGGCQGSTGPASVAPGEAHVYGARFPVVTIRDMVNVQYALLQQLGVSKLQLVIGGSMGGMQALEWTVMQPDYVERAAVIAANPAFTAMGLAYNEVMRQAIVSDPDYRHGNYAQVGVSPAKGLAIARMIGMITYRTAELFQQRLGRDLGPEGLADFQIGRYLRHHGDKLVERFDANSYLTLLRAMDLHDIGRNRGGLAGAFTRIRAELLWIGIDQDLLYPPEELRRATELAVRSGVRARYNQLSSIYGHDAFLLELPQLSQLLHPFLTQDRAVQQAVCDG